MSVPFCCFLHSGGKKIKIQFGFYPNPNLPIYTVLKLLSEIEPTLENFNKHFRDTLKTSNETRSLLPEFQI